MYVSWGNYEGPHTHDIPLEKILQIILKARPGRLVLEAATPSHQHDWLVFERIKLPDDKILVPGVMTLSRLLVRFPPPADVAQFVALDADSDDRIPGNLPRLELAEAPRSMTCASLCSSMLEDVRAPAKHDPSEPGPAVIVAIGNHRYHGVLSDILQALEHGAWPAFWFFVDRSIERAAAHRETYRHHMGDGMSIGSGKMRDPAAS